MLENISSERIKIRMAFMDLPFSVDIKLLSEVRDLHVGVRLYDLHAP